MKRTPLAERMLPDYTRSEEIWNMVTHILGGALGILALVLCPVFGARHHSAWSVVCGCIFAFCMLVLYAISSVAATSPEAISRAIRFADSVPA